MKKNRLLYITKNYDMNLILNSDVILSPEFYWVKKIKISTTKKRQVLSMAASVFAGALPYGKYRYKTQRLNSNEWLVIAYNSEEIISLLGDMKRINKIYFAQELCSHSSEKVLWISDNNFLVCIDGVASQLRSNSLSKDESIASVLEKCRLKESIDLGDMQNEIIDINSFYKVASVLFVIFVAFALNVGKSYLNLDSLQNRQNELLQTSGLPSTSFERDSILSPLKKKQKQIENFSKLTNGLTKLPSNYKKTLTSIELDKNELVLNFASKDIDKKSLKKEFSKVYKKISIKTNSNETTARLGL